jgi:hypothetical protein
VVTINGNNFRDQLQEAFGGRLGDREHHQQQPDRRTFPSIPNSSFDTEQCDDNHTTSRASAS